jgi:cell division protein FtsX
MSTIRWNKILRDLWKNKTKTILVVLAIAVGLFAFGSVFIVASGEHHHLHVGLR